MAGTVALKTGLHLVDVDFGKGDERPVAKEQNDEQVDPAREIRNSPMVKTATEQGISGGHHGKFHSVHDGYPPFRNAM